MLMFDAPSLISPIYIRVIAQYIDALAPVGLKYMCMALREKHLSIEKSLFHLHFLISYHYDDKIPEPPQYNQNNDAIDT